MSQKKMDAYKEAKKNVKQIRQKEKRNRILGWIFGTLIAIALIAGSVFLIYYTNVIKPEKEKAAAEAEAQEKQEGVDNIVNAVNEAMSNTESEKSEDAGSAEESQDSVDVDASDAATEVPAEVDASGAQAAPAEAPAEDAGSESEDQ